MPIVNFQVSCATQWGDPHPPRAPVVDAIAVEIFAAVVSFLPFHVVMHSVSPWFKTPPSLSSLNPVVVVVVVTECRPSWMSWC